MSTFSDKEVQYLVNNFLDKYRTCIKSAVLFIAPLAKAKLEKKLTRKQAGFMMTLCKSKIAELYRLGHLNAWSIDIYSEKVISSGILTAVV